MSGTPANTAPIYGRVPRISWGSTDGNGGSAGALKTANTAVDGTGTVLTVFTAQGSAGDTEGGSFLRALRIRALGTNVPTVLRVFLNNGSTNATLANNVLIDEITLTATTLSQTSALQPFEVPINLPIPPGNKINVTLGTSISAGVMVTGVGMDY